MPFGLLKKINCNQDLRLQTCFTPNKNSLLAPERPWLPQKRPWLPRNAQQAPIHIHFPRSVGGFCACCNKEIWIYKFNQISSNSHASIRQHVCCRRKQWCWWQHQEGLLCCCSLVLIIQYPVLDTHYPVLDTHYPVLDTVNPLSSFGYPLSSFGYLLLSCLDT